MIGPKILSPGSACKSVSNSQYPLVGLAMVHLLSAVKLKPLVSAATFTETIRQLSASLKQEKLLSTTGPIGKRFPRPIMDTDEADLDTFFNMSFESRTQLEPAVTQMTETDDLYQDHHRHLWNHLYSYRFTCWKD